MQNFLVNNQRITEVTVWTIPSLVGSPVNYTLLIKCMSVTKSALCSSQCTRKSFASSWGSTDHQRCRQSPLPMQREYSSRVLPSYCFLIHLTLLKPRLKNRNCKLHINSLQTVYAISRQSVSRICTQPPFITVAQDHCSHHIPLGKYVKRTLQSVATSGTIGIANNKTILSYYLVSYWIGSYTGHKGSLGRRTGYKSNTLHT